MASRSNERTDFAQMLSGGDRRSIGTADTVARKVLGDTRLFAHLFACLSHDDPRVRMRAADAMEKVTQEKPELLRNYKQQLLDRVAALPQQEVQWHLAQMIPRLELSPADVRKARRILDGYLKNTKSNIVRVMSLQALADLALQGKLKRDETARGIERYAELAGTPSVRARARILLKRLRK